MTNKLTLNDELQPLFENEDKQIWDLILDDKPDELLPILPREDVEDDTFDIILKELISTKESATLTSLNLASIQEGNAELSRDLIRLVFALDINGNCEEAKEAILQKLFDSFPELVEKIQVEAQGYPMRRIHDTIIAEAAGIRVALNMLTLYFQKKEDIDGLHFAVVLRTKITLSVLGNYKNVVGHDMIETAKVKERVGETAAALGFYNAAIENLKNELHWFVESPEMGPGEEDTIMLQSLKEAYQSVDRLNGTENFVAPCTTIDEILSREYIEYNFDDEEDDE